MSFFCAGGPDRWIVSILFEKPKIVICLENPKILREIEFNQVLHPFNARLLCSLALFALELPDIDEESPGPGQIVHVSYSNIGVYKQRKYGKSLQPVLKSELLT